MKSIYDWFGYELPIEERYKLIKKAGFEGVFLWWSNGFGRDSAGVDDHLRSPGLARKAGLIVENIHAPVKNQHNLWLDNLDGQTLEETYKKCLVNCSELEIPTMVIHLPMDDYCINDYGINRMKKIVEYAEKLKVKVALENLSNYSNLSHVLENIKSDYLGFCYDSCHHINIEPRINMLSQFGSRLMALHLHDNGGEMNQHEIPFRGNLDWHAIMSNIRGTNYTGSIALELMNWGYENISIEEFLHKAYMSATELETIYRTSI